MKNLSLYMGVVIGSYRLLRFVGFGPVSRVYLAEHENDPTRRVVFKLIDTEPLRTEQHRQRFLQEAFQVSQLQHPSLLPFQAAGIHGGVPYVVRDYVEAGSLQDRLEKSAAQPLPLNQALRVLQQIGAALHCAHQQRVVHANMKPENILWLDDEHMALADFRLHALRGAIRTARVRSATAARYMAPEQFQFQGAATPQTDQYAFACLAYKLLTGEVPFAATNFTTQAQQHTSEPPLPPSLRNANLPAYLDTVLLKALAKWPDERYVDMQALLAALSNLPPSKPTAITDHITLPPLAQHPGGAAFPAPRQPGQMKSALNMTQRSERASSPPNKPAFARRAWHAVQVFCASLLRASEKALLTTLVFLFDCLRKWREVLSLPKLCLFILWEKCRPGRGKIRARTRIFAALAAFRFIPRRMKMRGRKRWLARRLRSSRRLPFSTSPAPFPLPASPAQGDLAFAPAPSTKRFWTRRALLVAGGVGLTSAGMALGYVAFRVFPAHQSVTPALMVQELMPTHINATATPRALFPRQAKALLVFSQHRQKVRSVAWAPDGTTLASGADDHLLFTWSSAGHVHLQKVQEAAVNALAWSPDSRQFALATANRVLFLDTQTGKLLASNSYGHTSTVTSVAWSARQPQHLVSTGLDRLAIIWNTRTFQPQLVFRQHTEPVLSASWAPDGQTVGTCSEGGVTRVWNANNGRQLHGLLFDREITLTALAFEPAGTLLAVGGVDGVLRLWSNGLVCQAEGSGYLQGQCLDTPRLLPAHTGALRALAWSPNGHLLATAGDDGALLIWDLAQSQLPLLKMTHKAPVLAISWSPDGQKIAAASSNTVTLWALS